MGDEESSRSDAAMMVGRLCDDFTERMTVTGSMSNETEAVQAVRAVRKRA